MQFSFAMGTVCNVILVQYYVHDLRVFFFVQST